MELDYQVRRLIAEGIVPLEGPDAKVLVEAFHQLQPIITPEFCNTIPVNGIRGQLEKGPQSRRSGLYYGPEIDPQLPEVHRKALQSAMQNCLKLADRWFNDIQKVYNLDLSYLRQGQKFDTLTCAIYEATQDPEIALVGHTDFGLLTLGISNSEGLELYNNGAWVPIESGKAYIHTATYLQRALQNAGIEAHKATHRVKNCNAGRFFLGLFYEPGVDVAVNGKKYSDFIKESFASYK